METSASSPRKGQRIAGWVISGLIAAMLLMGVVMSFNPPKENVEMFTGKFGYPAETMMPLAIVELLCAILFLVPRTAVLGAVLLTGYLGGAVATHVRVHDNFIFPIVFGMLVWLAVYLREPRVRTVLPLTSA